jgi:hypothetical protein
MPQRIGLWLRYTHLAMGVAGLLTFLSLAILLAVPVLIAAFYLEPPLAGAIRRTTLLGCVLVFSGGVLHAILGDSRRD